MADKRREKSPILVPVDFSPHSEAALLQGSQLAECMKTALKVLHVVHDPAEMPGYYRKLTKKNKLVRMEDTAREMFEEFMQGMIKRYPRVKALKRAEHVLVVGLPVTRILEVADKSAAAMVVMGSQGRTGLKHMLLGSKAEQVVRLCPVPVTIVKAPPPTDIWNQ